MLIVTAKVSSSPNFVTLMMEAIRSSETSISQEYGGGTSHNTAFFRNNVSGD
jgi:hypothetical protein